MLYTKLQRKPVGNRLQQFRTINILWEAVIHCHEASSRIFLSTVFDTGVQVLYTETMTVVQNRVSYYVVANVQAIQFC